MPAPSSIKMQDGNKQEDLDDGDWYIYRGEKVTNRAGVVRVRIDETVTSIPARAFAYCQALEEVELHDGVTEIGSGVFEFCSALEVLEVPDSTKTIGDDCFQFCSALKTILLPNELSSIGQGAFHGCKMLKAISLPGSLSEISSETFRECDQLQTIVIPDKVTAIGSFAFYLCDSLQTVILPESVKVIGDGCFRGCSSLKEIHMPGQIESMGDKAFQNCAPDFKRVVLSRKNILKQKFRSKVMVCMMLNRMRVKKPAKVASVKKIEVYDEPKVRADGPETEEENIKNQSVTTSGWFSMFNRFYDKWVAPAKTENDENHDSFLSPEMIEEMMKEEMAMLKHEVETSGGEAGVLDDSE